MINEDLIAGILIDNWDEWDAEAQNDAQMEQDHEAYIHTMKGKIVAAIRDVSWMPMVLTATEVLDALRANHIALNRNDSVYWQAEQKIRQLQDIIGMIAACASKCENQDNICIEEIKRLADLSL